MPDPLPPVRHPARFVPLSAIAIGEPGAPALAVNAANPVPTNDQPLRSARALTPDIAVAEGRALMVDCGSAGKATFTLADATTLTLTLSPGLTLLPLSVTTITSTDLTAQCDAWVLD